MPAYVHKGGVFLPCGVGNHISHSAESLFLSTSTMSRWDSFLQSERSNLFLYWCGNCRRIRKRDTNFSLPSVQDLPMKTSISATKWRRWYLRRNGATFELLCGYITISIDFSETEWLDISEWTLEKNQFKGKSKHLRITFQPCYLVWIVRPALL